MQELEARRNALRADLAAAPPASPPVALHPGALARYRAEVARLEQALQEAAIRDEAAEALRALITRVVLTPDAAAADGLAALLHGDLAVILRLSEAAPRHVARAASGGNPMGTGVPVGLLSVVAGTGFEPVTFRL